MKAARLAAEKLKKPLSILVDLSGPKIRTRSLEDKKPVLLETDQLFTLTTRDIVGNEREVSTTFRELPASVKIGGTILLDDGSLELKVEDKNETDVIWPRYFRRTFVMRAKE